jgi:hypothetical protein
MKEKYLLTPILQGNLPKGQRSQQYLNPICEYLTQPRYPYKLNQKSLINGLAAVNEWFEKFEENPLDISTLGELTTLVLSHTVFLTDPEGYSLQISHRNLTLVCPLAWFFEGGNG